VANAKSASSLKCGPYWAAFLLCLGCANAFSDTPNTIDFSSSLIEVEAVLAEHPDELQLHFTRGMLLGELGRYREAADEFRWMLAVDPSLLRPRLELGRVLYLEGSLESARYHFQQVLANELPDTVRDNVLRILARVREQSPFFTISFEAITDSNPKQATSSKEVAVGGLRYQLSDSSKAHEASGFRTAFDGKMPFTSSSLWFVRSSGEIDLYDDAASNYQYLELAVGKNFSFASDTATVELGMHHADFGQQRLYEGAIFSVSDFHQFRPDFSVKATVSAQQLDYYAFTYLSGWQNSVTVNALYAVSPVARWDTSVGFMQNSAINKAYSFQQITIGNRYVQEWAGGWITGAALYANSASYQDIDPLFGVVRRDTEARIEVDIANRKYRFLQFTPKVQFGHVGHRSNIDLYSFNRNYVRVGLTGEF
jgi:tetratricopeptide (TPR) repeat protein